MRNVGPGPVWLLPGLFIATLCLAVPVVGQGGDPLEQARETFSAFESRSAELQQAQQQGDAERAQRLQGEMEELLGQARSLFERGQALARGDAEALRDYARTLENLGQFDLAVAALEKVVDEQPEDAVLLVALGKAHRRTGEAGYEPSIGVFRRAIQLAPAAQSAVEAWTGLGDVYRELRLYALSREAYEAAVDLNARDAGALFGLAALDIRDGHMVAASRTMEQLGGVPTQALSVLQDSLDDFVRAGFQDRWTAEEHLAYARLLFFTGSADRAVSPVEEALALAPEDADAWRLAGDIYQTTELRRKAIEAYGKSLELDADQPALQQLMNQIDAR